MITCVNCGIGLPHGAIICDRCGNLLGSGTGNPLVVAFLPQFAAVAVHKGTQGPRLLLHVVYVDGKELQVGDHTAVVPFSRLNIPLAIGRRDHSQSPPHMPAIDLQDHLAQYGKQGERVPVSRLHATIELDGGVPMIWHRARQDGTTWIRRSGDASYRVVNRGRPDPITHMCVVLLGDPRTRCVKLRVGIETP